MVNSLKPNNGQRQQLWVLTDGNGAGKTTFYNHFLKPRRLIFVNADQIAQQLDSAHPETASYKAAILAGQLRKKLLREGTSFC